MRFLAFERPGVLAWREASAPKLSSDLDAIVAPAVVGRCDLDVGFVQGVAPIPAGSALGHECIAKVVEVGPLVRTVQPGDLLLVSAQICCGYCRSCKRGHTGRCEAVPFAASFGMGRAGRRQWAQRRWIRRAIHQVRSVLRVCRGGIFKPDDVPTTVFDFDRADEAWLSSDLRVAVARRDLLG